MKNQPAPPSETGALEAHRHPLPEKVAAASHASASPFKRILVALDFSDCSLRALEHALALAAPFHARLILLHVVEPAVLPAPYRELGSALAMANQNLAQSGEERLAELSQKRVGNRVPSEIIVRVGHAHSEIPDTARALGAELIVLGGRSVLHASQGGLGSTTERVLRHAPCPVLTVPPRG